MTKRVALGTLLLATAFAMVPSARATSVSGSAALAGVNTYTLSSVTFDGPGVVFKSTGSLATGIPGAPVMSTVTMDPSVDFATADGIQLFTNGVVTMTINTWNVLTDTAVFLNIEGTAVLTQTGFSPLDYDYTLTSTTVGTSTTYALALDPIPEPGTLFLVGSGLLGLAALLFRRAKKPTSTLPS